MINNTIHQVNFSVRKYGTANEVASKLSNVFEDEVFEDEVFEF